MTEIDEHGETLSPPPDRHREKIDLAVDLLEDSIYEFIPHFKPERSMGMKVSNGSRSFVFVYDFGDITLDQLRRKIEEFCL